MENMSNEELLELVKKLKKENEEKDELLKKKDQEIEQCNQVIDECNDKILHLEAEKRDLNIKLEELIAKYEDKLQARRKILADTYAPKSEKTPKCSFILHHFGIMRCIFINLVSQEKLIIQSNY